MTYHELVQKTQVTSISQPMMVEGVLKDGRHFFFHYNFTYATLGLGQTRMDALREGMLRGITVDSDLPGWLRDDQFHEIFMELYGLYETPQGDTVSL